MFSSVLSIRSHISQTNLTEASSVAIWNKNRLVVGTAIVVWATNVSLAIILGKLALSLILLMFRNPLQVTNVIYRYRAGEY